MLNWIRNHCVFFLELHKLQWNFNNDKHLMQTALILNMRSRFYLNKFVFWEGYIIEQFSHWTNHDIKKQAE